MVLKCRKVEGKVNAVQVKVVKYSTVCTVWYTYGT